MTEAVSAPARRRRRLAVEGLVAAVGAAFVVAALLADQAWFDRHFLPVFFLSRRLQVLGETGARIVLGGLGLALILAVRPIAGRAAQRNTPGALAAGALGVLAALALAAGVSELLLRANFPRAREEDPPNVEPRRQPDARLGWVFTPSRVGRNIVAGRPIDYAFDAHGYRVPSLAQPVDVSRPTLLFAGESIVTGYGLRWDETFPARVGEALRLQSANLSVLAYADDQTYLRLAGELPRFARPKAVVILFSPALFFRDFDEDRPHLDPGLVWRPAVHGSRLLALLRYYAPYHSASEIDRKIALVRAELWAGVRAAHARGAAALIVAPHFGAEAPNEAALRRRILDEAGLPYVLVDLDPSQRIARDPHPNAAGARAIAAAIVGRLQAAGPG
jgi:hypothetical protein